MDKFNLLSEWTGQSANQQVYHQNHWMEEVIVSLHILVLSSLQMYKL